MSSTAVICTLGDVLLDVDRPDQPSRSRPAPTARSETRLATGGQAANVAAWVAELGSRAPVCVAKAGRRHRRCSARSLLDARGVELVGPVVAGTDRRRRRARRGRRRADDGDRPRRLAELRAEELDPAWFEGCSRLHLSGYSLLAEPIAEAALAAARLARSREARDQRSTCRRGARSATTGRSASARTSTRLAPDVVFANEPGVGDGRRRLRARRDRGRQARLARRRGADGRGRRGVRAARRSAVVDTTGRRRRARGRLPRRRDRARPRGGSSLCGPARGGAG